MIARISIALLIVVACACGPQPAKDIGAQLFVDPRTGTSEANVFACSTCHAVDSAGDKAAVFSGYPLNDSMFRERFWGGQVSSPLEAMNVCLTFFMKSAPFSADEPKSRALYEYLASISSKKETKPRKVTVVETVTTVARGDPDKGKELWDQTCRECHGDPHTGDGRLADNISVVPEASEEFAETLDGDFTPDLIIVEKVRHGVFFNVGGTMPPFSTERLSDKELGQILGYLKAKD